MMAFLVMVKLDIRAGFPAVAILVY